MKSKSWVVIITFIAFLFQLFDIQANNFSKTYHIQWKNSTKIEISPDKSIEILNFEGALVDETFTTLPLFFDKFSVENFFDSYQFSVTDIQTLPLSSKEKGLIPENFAQNSLNLEVRTECANKKNYTTIRFIPILGEKGNYRKVISCTISIQGIISNKGNSSQKDYVNQSILAFGNWHKISVVNTGIHKITHSELLDMGIISGNIASNQIAIFGNGGGMLSETNSDPRLDDLQEISILVADGNDGTFDNGDYILFYAQGPHTWKFNESDNTFSHQYNIYSLKAYYFICIDAGIGEKKRILKQDNSGLTATQTINTFKHYQFYENDVKNFGESGRHWFDEGFDMVTQKNYTLTIPPLTPAGGKLIVNAGSTTSSTSYFDITANGTNVGRMSLAGTFSDDLLKISNKTLNVGNITSPMTLNFTYSKPHSSAVAHLDWFEFQAEAQLTMFTNQVPFCQPNSVGTSVINQYRISNANTQTMVWDITDHTTPILMQGELNGDIFTFKATADSLRYFLAFNGGYFHTVTSEELVTNQNLHGSFAELVIITHPNFLDQAERLAKHKRANGLSTIVATTTQVYNEFSSGALDPTAIRDYMRMMYKKSNGEFPKYLLLMGRPSYDYREISEGTKCYVPNYQYNKEVSERFFRSFDDYFGLLDDNEGLIGTSLRGLIDVAVGRFPCSNSTQARIAVQKSIDYSAKTDLTNGNSTLISNFADWRNIIAFVADDEDANEHISVSEACANIIKENYPSFNFDKIYCDAYPQESFAGGQRYPEVNTALNNRMNRGALLYSYVGHSSGASWAHERILEISDIHKWSNRYNQPLITTMSCEFGWYDRKSISPAELSFFNENGGGVGLITTSRVAYIGPNSSYIRSLATHIFHPIDNHKQTLGEVNQMAKNSMGGVAETINMIYLIGDPSLPLNIPEFQIVTDSINGKPIETFTDTLKALSKVDIKGRIIDTLGNILTSFNGNIFPSIYDKATKGVTLLNDVSDSEIAPFEFEQQKNILFKGNSSVTNGQFSFSFIIPKDINYTYGNGKISYYATNKQTDATGYSNTIIIGGISENPIEDKRGPEIDIFINDESFVNGGTTAPNALLLVKLKDEFGINTTGNGIGHDLVAILDNNTDKQIILNDYYLSEQDSFNCGTVRYPLSELTIGNHTLTVRAWDIANNVSENSIDFTVVSDEDFTLEHVLNYPNPFTTHTDFYFEHNRIGTQLDITIQIFTISGKLVKTLTSSQLTKGNRSEPISWDGRDDFGDKLGKGVYIYKLKVRNANGEIAEKTEKIAIL